MPVRPISLAGIMLIAAGCSSSGASSTTTTGRTTASNAATSGAARRGSATLITLTEITQAGAGLENAMEIVERLRPAMLRPRNTSMGNSTDRLMVYHDNVRVGDVTSMRTIPATSIREIRLVSATDATQRWGTGHSQGAIEVVSRR